MIRFLWILVLIAVVLAAVYYLTSEKSKADGKMYRILKKRYLDAMKDENTPLMIAAGRDFAKSHVATQDDLDQLYVEALRLAKEDHGQKQYALEIGRLKYGAAREDKRPTADDEAAIRNDIEVLTRD